MSQKNILNTPSVEAEELVSHGFSVSRVWVQSEQAAEDLKKPCGRYITINTGPLDKLDNFEGACTCLVEQLQPLLAPFFGKSLCICGVGNRDLEFDSLGPETAKRIRPHMFEIFAPKANFEKIEVIYPQPIGLTNVSIESFVSSLASTMNAACVLTIDSCSCNEIESLCNNIHLTDTGVKISTTNAQLCQSSLGMPVISIGVPTAIGASHLIKSEKNDSNLSLTPVYVAEAIQVASFTIACAVAQIAYPDLDYNDCKQCIGLFLNGIM